MYFWMLLRCYLRHLDYFDNLYFF
ncbi:putative formin-like protein 6 isoform X2 [Iris pallida]|uniref:Formin-like protein 6 isoform X2 n=1 Tax=Iris pallida TaxID=29817 RepID=A0AAX6G651_IRIPA|nr:putative formin-like protein 6 isoform X2 [Iris pallida]